MIASYMGINDLQRADFRLYRENGTADYLFVLFKSPAEVWSEGAFRRVGWGQCIFFDRKSMQHYYPIDGTEFLHDFIHLEPETDEEYSLLITIPKNVPLELSLPDAITSVLNEVQTELRDRLSAYQHEVISHLLHSFLFRLKRESERENISIARRPHYQKFYALRAEIYRNPRLAGSVSEMAKQLHISESHFQHLYKEFFSVSYMDDVIGARMNFAKTLLINTDLKIYEIADRCGCSSIEHFIRLFRRNVGCSPGKFRAGGIL